MTRYAPAPRTALPVAQLARAARIVRLRTGLSLNHAAVGAVLDLLDRIEELETALRAQPGVRPDGHWR